MSQNRGKNGNCKGMVGAQVASRALIKKVNEWDDSWGVLTSERTLYVWWGQPWAKAKSPLAIDEDRIDLTPDGRGLPCLFLEVEALFVSVGN